MPKSRYDPTKKGKMHNLNARLAQRKRLTELGLVSPGDDNIIQYVDGNPFNTDFSNIRIVNKNDK